MDWVRSPNWAIPPTPEAFDPTAGLRRSGRSNISQSHKLGQFTAPVPNAARHLHKRGCRRIILGSGWVATPNVIRASAPGSSQPGGVTMKWTKPEAEVVAVTMEVTAYVATL
jgi:hypothetical protein